MAKKDQVLRLYSITDPEMYEAAKTKRGFFIQDKADFIAFDADFHDPYAVDWLALITDAEALPQDETLDDQLTQLTETVGENMEICRTKFQDSKYFIEKTFPNAPKIWNEFGYNNYNSSRRVQVNMIQFMKNFHATATKYNTELIAKNYTQLMIDEIETFRNDLDVANQKQESFIGNIPVQTQARHDKNNEVWTVIANVCTAGKRIYKNNFAKYQRYLLPPGEESPEAVSITGLVTDSAGSTPLQGVAVTVNPGEINTTTASNGRYSVGALPDGNYTLLFSLAGYADQALNVTITGSNAVELNVQMVHV